RRETLPDLAASAGATETDRLVLAAQRRAAAGRIEAAVRLQCGQRLPRFCDRRPTRRRPAQAVRGRDRTDPQRRRRSLTARLHSAPSGADVRAFWIFSILPL